MTRSDPADPDGGTADVTDKGATDAATEAASEAAVRADPARAALADARALSRTAPGRRPARGSPETRRRNRADNLRGRANGTPLDRNRGGYSGPGADPERDPHRIGPLLADYLGELGWQRPLAQGRVFADWGQLVGPEVAAHCTPQSLRDGELRIAAESSAWASQLRLLSATVLARLVAELGPDVVTRLAVTGPTGPSWKHGPRSVPGSRGPRDTYG